MKKAFKYLLLPLSFSCCSMTINTTSIQFASFSIDKEDDTNIYLRAHVDILVDNYGRMCDYKYYWIENNGTSHVAGYSAISALAKAHNYALVLSNPINKEELKRCSPVTFKCEAKVKDEPIYITTLNYSMKTTDYFTITEETNNQELTTGYIKQSTFTDPTRDYYYDERFTFLNFEDLRVNELYYDLDVSYLRFRYHNGLDNTLKGDFKFAFYDRYNLFPDFPIGESMYRYIPLTLNQDHGECYFTFTPTMYYDPVTHDCSLIQKPNYIQCHKLMLPFTYASELKFLPCYFELKVKDHTNFTIYGKFMMTYLKKYFGECEDSEFCDTMQQDDEVNVREKVVEVTI